MFAFDCRPTAKPRTDTAAIKAALKKAAKVAKGKPMKGPPPATWKCRNKNNYVKGHRCELPECVQQLLNESSVYEKGRLINDFVVRDSDGRWCFNLEAAYLKETVCG